MFCSRVWNISRVSKRGYETFWTVIFQGMKHIQIFMKKGSTKHFRCFIFNTRVWNIFLVKRIYHFYSILYRETITPIIMIFSLWHWLKTMPVKSLKSPNISFIFVFGQFPLPYWEPQPSPPKYSLFPQSAPAAEQFYNVVLVHGVVRWPVCIETWAWATRGENEWTSWRDKLSCLPYERFLD